MTDWNEYPGASGARTPKTSSMNVSVNLNVYCNIWCINVIQPCRSSFDNDMLSKQKAIAGIFQAVIGMEQDKQNWRQFWFLQCVEHSHNSHFSVIAYKLALS